MQKLGSDRGAHVQRLAVRNVAELLDRGNVRSAPASLKMANVASFDCDEPAALRFGVCQADISTSSCLLWHMKSVDKAGAGTEASISLLPDLW